MMDGWSRKGTNVSIQVRVRDWGADPTKLMTLVMEFIKNYYYAIAEAIMG